MEQCPQVLFRGFVNDIDAYYQAADLFINPITNDSGVKTKVIEALANNCTVVSFESGATGISKEVCGDMLQVVANGDYSAFAQKIIEVLKKEKTNTPQSFYDSYNWDNIAQKAAQYIKTVVQQHG
jgi:glycosyltransferase involved in cell wall biosynthesis